MIELCTAGCVNDFITISPNVESTKTFILDSVILVAKSSDINPFCRITTGQSEHSFKHCVYIIISTADIC